MNDPQAQLEYEAHLRKLEEARRRAGCLAVIVFVGVLCLAVFWLLFGPEAGAQQDPPLRLYRRPDARSRRDEDDPRDRLLVKLAMGARDPPR